MSTAFLNESAQFTLRWLLRLLIAGVIFVGGCGPRFTCPVRTPPNHGAYTLVTRHQPSSLYFGSPDARVVIDPACSTVCIDDDDQGGLTALSGTIDLTIDPACTGPTCVLTFAGMDFTAEDFRLHGGMISQLHGWEQSYDWGLWAQDDTFAISASSLNISAKYVLNDTQYGQAYSNFDGALWGTLDRDYDNFSLAGDFARGIHLSLCGRPVAHPPIAVLAPSGPFHANSDGIAHVTVSSSSYDPDGDLSHRWWRVDDQTQAFDGITLQLDLPIGTHSVSMTELDSRGAKRTATATLEVLP